ncbi:MAG: glycosyltransferase [Patescibacteria group bacterium]|nr:glycosyltransferase [Patescibacteria group bacterium]
MKILFTSPLKRSITPTITASRPRVIYDLITGLVKKGHKISILAAGDTDIPGVKVVPVIPKSWVNLPAPENEFYRDTSTLTKMAKMMEKVSSEFDLIHNHCYPEYINLLVAENIKKPIVTTVHAQMTEELDDVLSTFNNVKNSYLISISQAHKSLAKSAKIFRVVYNGIDTNLYKFEAKKDDYLLWVGRLGKAKDKAGKFIDAKGVRWAIQLAQKTNSHLKMVGNVEDIEFYNRDVKPHLSDKIQWACPISKEQPLSKMEIVKLMQKAKAYLMPINWFEPFGLVMAEAGSCGTPVIGFDRGSVRELIKNGKTGLVVNPKEGITGLVKALEKIDQIKPEDCRAHIEKNFSLDATVNNYEKLYKDILGRK